MFIFAFNVKADFEFKLTCEFGANIFYIYLVPPKEKNLGICGLMA